MAPAAPAPVTIAAPAPAAAAPAPAEAPAAASAAPSEVEEEGFLVAAPMVGTFYAASSPGAAPYVQVGDRVNEGDTLCIIEAMKMQNEIAAPSSAVVQRVHVESGQAVGAGEVLVTLKGTES